MNKVTSMLPALFPMSDDEIVEVFRSLKEGDRVRLTFAPRSSSSPKDVRDVDITGRSSNYVHTSSGKVRPGHFSGGMIYDWTSNGQGVVYQPTIQQQVRRVLAIHKVISAADEAEILAPVHPDHRARVRKAYDGAFPAELIRVRDSLLRQGLVRVVEGSL